MKKALVTGITGQDGSYLTELLIQDGYEVHGVMRRASVFTTERIEHLLDNPKLVLHHGDLNDSSNLTNLVSSILPDEIYHLGAQSHVGVSFEVPEYTGDVVGLGTLRLLNAIKSSGKQIKFYNAATSEMFGGLPETAPQSEATPFHPKSPYGAAKLYSFWLTVNYREAFGLFASNGILFNHESPRRGQTFVTRKISLAAARISKTNEGELVLGNLDAVRDWGFAGDYVKAMRAMLSQDSPDDFVIATGRSATVREFASMAFLCAGIELSWQGSGVDEVGIDSKSGKKIVRVSERYYRPSEVDVLIGDSTKAERILGWKPELDLEGLVKLMVESDLQNV